MHGISEGEYDDCWLRYAGNGNPELYRTHCSNVYASVRAPELGVVRDELRRGLQGLLGREPHFWQHPPRSADGFLAIGTPSEMEVIVLPGRPALS
ncbi:alpha-glucuronidase family glycosyl hydrolase [Haladaptatus sp. DFWS20]|uniref:alpha-glucuronidase family glycosyl hydrolase n=1 Tax=Haladaptatus sp. DFWS20 TaxID=3403467 RepID=UPI003EB6DC3A